MAETTVIEPPARIQPAAPPPRRRHTDLATMSLGIGLGIVTTILGLIALAWLVLFITKGRFLKPTFETYAGRFAGRTVRVSGDFQFYFDPIDVKFLAEGLTVSNPGNPAFASEPNFFQARLFHTRVATIPLILGHQRINSIELRDAHIDAEWDKAHKLNTWSFGPGKPFKMPEIVRAVVSGTSVRYRDPLARMSADIRFDTVNAHGKTIDNAIRFAGGGSVRGKPFTLDGAQTSPNQLLAGGRNQFELHARAANSRVDIAGTLPGETVIEGADLTVQVRGQNLADLASLAGVTTPNTRPYRIRSHLTKAAGEYRFTHLTGTYGNSDLEGALTFSMPGNRPTLKADLASRVVDMIDIGPFIGFDANKLATQGAAAAATTQHKNAGYPRILPDAPLQVEAIKTFDAHVVYNVKDIRQKFVPISNVSLTLDLDHSRLALSPLTFDIAGGHLASDIILDARVRPIFTSYDIRLSPTPMGKLLTRFGVAENGTTGTIGARIKMTGTGDTVRASLGSSNGRIVIIMPQGTFWTRNIQLAEFDVGTFLQRMFQKKLKEPVQINCGEIAFTVRDGVAAADPILIDTSKNVMTGRGGFSFKDESIDVLFRADAKKISLFSAQSPVGIRGHFATPALQIVTPQLLTRVGVAVGLGIVATPIAALIPFVDPGDAKAAACVPVLEGANAAAQRTTKGKPRKDVGTRTDNREDAANGHGKKKKFLGIF